MGVGLRIGSRFFELGSPAFFHAFFSTVAVRAEDEQWGSRFPIVMGELYGGEVDASSAERGLRELDGIELALSGHPPDHVVWDFERRDARPPWGDDVSPEVTSLANYFVTSDGRELLATLREGLRHSVATGMAVRVE